MADCLLAMSSKKKNVASLRDSAGEKTSIGHRKDSGLHLSQAVGKHEEAVVADEVDEGQGLEELLLSLAAKADNLKGHEAKQLKNCQLANNLTTEQNLHQPFLKQLFASRTGAGDQGGSDPYKGEVKFSFVSFSEFTIALISVG